MTRLTRCFPSVPSLQTQLIGLDELFKYLEPEPSKFPPMNIVAIPNDDNTYSHRVEIALAGYKKSDLEVVKDGRQLIIRTKPGYTNTVDADKYLMRDISSRAFSRSLALASEYIEVTKVAFEDGLLTIHLEMNLPEKLKPKTFNIL